jgi:transglutaminase-like putative cysteine protease
VALAGLTFTAIYGFSRIFETLGFLWPLLTLAAGVHLATALLRRRGVGVALSFLAVAGGWALAATWLFFRETTFALLPTPSTLDAVTAEADRSWTAFRELVAPAPALTGFVLAGAVAVGVGAFLADWAAFRMWSTRDALVPSLTLFVFATLLASERQRIPSVVLYVAACLVFVLVHRVARLERSSGWVTSARAAGGSALLRVGLALGVVALLVGAVVGPRLPGVDETAIVDWRGGEDDSGRVTVSPLVDIRSRLVERSDTEVFQVRSEAPSYWRMTALDDFDGSIWRSDGSYQQIAGPLPTDMRFPSRSTEVLDQEFLIQNLSTLWLPAAFQPLAVDSSVPIRYQEETSTLIVDPEASSADGASYSVRSAIIDLSPEQLRSADPTVTPDLAPMVELPSDFSDSVRDLAREVVAGADTAYDQALALQGFFRDTGGFVYDLDIDSGHGEDAIESFLETRRGYCEQFAGTFAAMARSIGLPARVAVGFTWGDPDPEDPEVFQVRGRNAHAWPEVHLGAYGWVAFEPTPGRGSPTGESYTGERPSQESGPSGAEASPSTTEAAPTTTAPSDPDQPADEQASELLDSSGGGALPGGGGGTWITTAAAGAVLLAVAAAGYGALVTGTRTRRRHRRRRAAAGSPPAEVAVAWSDAGERLGLLRLAPRPDETHAEVATRVGAALPEQASAVRDLAGAADLAAYGPGGLDAATAVRARADADALIDAVVARVPWWRRLLVALDPRSLRRSGDHTRHRVDRPHD